MIFRTVFLCLLIGSLFTNCTRKVATTTVMPVNELLVLKDAMTGTFNSSKQSKENEEYYDITLQMYPIWKKDNTAQWLYVEQAVSSMQDQPYRQRIYKLEEVEQGRTFASHVYELKDDSLFVGKWSNPSFFDSYSPQTLLQEREGCTVFLTKKTQGKYVGSTKDDRCKSSLRGASYATSKVEITPMKITSWDQGFDLKGEQVWGAVEGPYVFDRINM